MKNGVGVIENVFRAESLFQIAPPIWHECQINRISKMFHKFCRKIRAATIFMRHKFSLLFSLAIRIKIKWKDSSDVENGYDVFANKSSPDKKCIGLPAASLS